MKIRNSIKYGLWFIVGSLFVLLNVACGGVAASEEIAGEETAVSSLPSTGVFTPTAPLQTTPVAATQTPTVTALPPTSLPTETPTLLPTRPLPVLQNPINPEFEQMAQQTAVSLLVVDGSNSGVWQYPEDTFIHPLAFAVHENTGYLLDAGRVLAVDLKRPLPAETLLQGGDVVENVTVLEPLDLHVAPDGLLVLDRAGDVYRYDWQTLTWHLDWYDRPIRDTSSHYYVALAGEGNGRYLLETSYNYAMRYENGEQQSLWNLPEARGIDLTAVGERVYVLEQSMFDTEAMLTAYEATSKLTPFRPTFRMEQARQVVATGEAVYVLDQNGKRLLVLSPETGQLQTILQLPPDEGVSAFAIAPETGQLLFAGRNRLYFYDRPDEIANVPGEALLRGVQPYDPALLASISGFAPPIGWDISTRDLQMPGAPRHYRLGVHEGADFYWARDSQVFAAADGVVIRAMKDYVPPFPAAFYDMRNQSLELGYTSEEALDFYRGQQVWLEHENGVISRYIHLGSIAWDLEEGQTVTQGQFIGTVGNSGSPASLESPDSDVHLHFELWVGDSYIGQFLRPVETRDWYESILHDQP